MSRRIMRWVLCLWMFLSLSVPVLAEESIVDDPQTPIFQAVQNANTLHQIGESDTIDFCTGYHLDTGYTYREATVTLEEVICGEEADVFLQDLFDVTTLLRNPEHYTYGPAVPGCEWVVAVYEIALPTEYAYEGYAESPNFAIYNRDMEQMMVDVGDGSGRQYIYNQTAVTVRERSCRDSDDEISRQTYYAIFQKPIDRREFRIMIGQKFYGAEQYPDRGAFYWFEEDPLPADYVIDTSYLDDYSTDYGALQLPELPVRSDEERQAQMAAEYEADQASAAAQREENSTAEESMANELEESVTEESEADSEEVEESRNDESSLQEESSAQEETSVTESSEESSVSESQQEDSVAEETDQGPSTALVVIAVLVGVLILGVFLIVMIQRRK